MTTAETNDKANAVEQGAHVAPERTLAKKRARNRRTHRTPFADRVCQCGESVTLYELHSACRLSRTEAACSIATTGDTCSVTLALAAYFFLIECCWVYRAAGNTRTTLETPAAQSVQRWSPYAERALIDVATSRRALPTFKVAELQP